MIVNYSNDLVPRKPGTSFAYAVRTDKDCGRKTCCFSEKFDRDAYRPPIDQTVQLVLPEGIEGVEEVCVESDEFGVLKLD